MRYTELTETTRNLGGFNVKVVASVPGGAEQEVDESGTTATHRIGLTVTDPNHPMVSKRGETYHKTVRVTGDDREKAINSAIAHYRRKGYKVHDHHYIGIVEQGVAEGAPELLKKEMPLHRHAEKLLAQNGVSKDDPDYHHHLGNTIKHLRQFGNIDLINKQGVAEGRENYNGVNILFQKDDDEIFVKASAGGRELGHVLFVIDGDYLMPQNLEVEERFRGQGIAQTMYDYVKSKGYKIRRSGQQTDAGAGFWDKHKGQGQNVWEQGAAEGSELKKAVDEAIKIDAPQKSWSKQDMQDYLTRIKAGTKTKQDRFKPIIHGSNVKAITKDDGNQEWDLDDLARQITTRPRAILGTNAKMAKSKIEGSITYDLTLPALSGIVVDEETGEFVEITTCPGAGECQLYCYARKGGYVMFPASSMSAAQALNFLVNHPEDYMKMFDSEVKKAKALATKNGIKLLVRVHDAGDFFSKEYYDLVMGVKAQNPDCKFYFYTKMGAIASADQPDDVIGQFSPGAKSREVKTVQVQRDAGKHVKDAVTLPKEMFRNLFVTDPKGKYVKDAQGRTQVKSEEVWAEFKQKLADIYKLDVDTIVTYDQMNRIPEGPKPKWNVVVFPAGHGDLGASRLDVSKQFLMFH